MTEDETKMLNDLFPGWEPVVIEDEEGLNFDKPIKGKYVARIVSLERREGTSQRTGNPYDFVSLKLQIVEDKEGDRSANRYLDKTYSCIDGEYSTAQEDLQKLLNDLFTAGLLEGMGVTKGGMEGILECAEALTDKTVNVSCWGTKKGNQSTKIVKEHKLKEEKGDSSDDWDA